MFLVPLEAARAEIIVLHSRFIASLSPVDSVEEARAYIASIRGEFPDASHNVPAFIVGGEKSRVEYCSDDGEPSGTSGRPLLAVLRGSGLGNLAVVVTRYFGGTLLGSGGLVKAYSESGRLVLEKTRRGKLVEVSRLELALPYHLYEPAKALAAETGAELLEENFGEEVSVRLEIPVDALSRFETGLAELSSGRLQPRRLGSGISRRPIG